MEPYYKNLGKVRPTVEGDWSIDKDYSVLSIVYDDNSNKSYISKKNVPKGIHILNKEYWQLFGNTRIDNDSILIFSELDEYGYIKSYELKDVINSISNEDRRLGMFISFYEKPNDITENYRWNVYQFNSNNINDWDDITAWSSIYYSKTKFFGLVLTEDVLYNIRKNPDIGDYAFVGETLVEATIYRCNNKNVWSNTEEKAINFLSIVLQGNVTIGYNGNWFNNGIDTGIQARGPEGKKAPKITSITLNKNEEGEIVNGVCNFDDLSSIEITIN